MNRAVLGVDGRGSLSRREMKSCVSDTMTNPEMPEKSWRLCVTRGQPCRTAVAATQASWTDIGFPERWRSAQILAHCRQRS